MKSRPRGKHFCYNTVKRIVMSKVVETDTVSDENIIKYFSQFDEPVLTSMDIAEAFDISQQAAHSRLSNLHEEGILKRRKVGGRAVVWWLANSY